MLNMSYQILIVDDDSEFREEIHECLKDYKVIEASNGMEALEILKKPHAIDLVILDVSMPGLLGTEVLKKIRDKSRDLPVVILTGHSSKDVAIEALKGHATDYIEKPFEVRKFLSIVQRILDKKNQGLTIPTNKMERVKSFLERNFDKKISLNHVADEICLSPKYLSRLFKETTGLGFNEYRLKIKIQKAAELLRTTPMTIHEISSHLGYQNPESFIRIFEKIINQTPTEYRSNNKNLPRKKTT